MKKFLFLLPFVLISVVILSCGDDDKEEDIQGTWELVTKPVGGFRFFWEMKEGKIKVSYMDSSATDTSVCVEGDYIIKNGVFSVIAPVAYCEFSTYDGDWEIQKLNKKYLYLLRYLPRGTIWLEFARRD